MWTESDNKEVSQSFESGIVRQGNKVLTKSWDAQLVESSQLEIEMIYFCGYASS